MTIGKRKPAKVTAAIEARTARDKAEATIPPAMRIAASWSWRILVVLAVLAAFVWLVAQLRLILVPFMIAILLAALLVPLVTFLVRHRWPKGLAVAFAEVGILAVVAGLVVLIVIQVRSGFPDLQKQSVEVYDDFKAFLRDSPLQLSDADISGYIDQAFAAIQEDSQALVSGALSFGSSAGHILTGILLTLFATLFLLIDGKGIWNWCSQLFPRQARPAVVGAGNAGWVTLTTFVRVQIFVAFVDAVGIGLGAWILGMFYGGFPLVIPIAIAVFLGSFIPVVGAVLTGALAVFVALIYLNPFAALIMLAIVLLVQQIEGHVLQPLVMGTAVKVHPLAVVFAVAAGGFLAGIPGALFAVPVVATLNAMVNYIARGQWRDDVQAVRPARDPKDVPRHA
ncbi:AI-2E family transporter [soil metagenome]